MAKIKTFVAVIGLFGLVTPSVMAAEAAMATREIAQWGQSAEKLVVMSRHGMQSTFGAGGCAVEDLQELLANGKHLDLNIASFRVQENARFTVTGEIDERRLRVTCAMQGVEN